MQKYYFTLKTSGVNQLIVEFKLKETYTSISFNLKKAVHDSPSPPSVLNEAWTSETLKDYGYINGYIIFKRVFNFEYHLPNYLTFELIPNRNINFLSIRVSELDTVPTGILFFGLIFALFSLCICVLFIAVWPKHPYLTESIYDRTKRKKANTNTQKDIKYSPPSLQNSNHLNI